MTAKIRLAAAVLLVLAASAACGSGLAGDALGSNGFCDALEETAELEATGQEPKPEDMAELSEKLLDRLPGDAPRDLRDMLTATSDVAKIADKYDGTPDLFELDEDERSRIFEAQDVFERVDGTGVEAWMTNTCPDVVSRAGLLSGLGGTGQNEAASSGATQPLATATPMPTPTPTPSPTPTPIPVLREVINPDAADMEYRAATVDVGEIVATNGTTTTFFGNEQLADSVLPNRIFFEMFMQRTTHGGTVEADSFRLYSPEGRSTAAANIFDSQGQRVGSIALKPQDSADFFVAFDLDEQITDAGAWHLRYGNVDSVPAVIPLKGAAPSPYPIDLPVVGEYVYDHKPGADGCGYLMTLLIDSAQIDLEGLQGNDFLERIPSGSRYVNFDIATVNNIDPVDASCYHAPHPRSGYEWRLAADGRPYAPDQETFGLGSVSIDEIEKDGWRFPIPSDTTELSLVDATGLPILTWTVDVPPTFGEDGWQPSPTFSAPELIGGDAADGRPAPAATTSNDVPDEANEPADDEDTAADQPANAQEPAEEPLAELTRDELKQLRASHLDAAVDGDTSLCFVTEASLTTIVFMGGDLLLEDEMVDDMINAFAACDIDPLAVAKEAGLR